MALHTALVFWFGERARSFPPLQPPAPMFQVAVDAASIRAVNHAPELADPALFALPSPSGFSGAAWLEFAAASAPSEGWTEPPQWLPLDTNGLGGTFTRFVAANRRNGSVMENLLKLHTTTADILLVNDPVRTQTVVRLEGALTNRALLAPIPAPNPVHAEVLPDTVVQVKVDWDGVVESGILLAGCGVKPLDDRALVLAKSARFRPRPAESGVRPPTWGRMIFQWFTVPPEATNSIALKLE